jgi:hypothetical protein
MHVIGKLGLLATVWVAAALAAAGSAVATNDTFEPDTGTQGSEHVTIGLATPNAQWVTGLNSHILCNQVTGEGTFDDLIVEEGLANENGAFEALDFIHNGAQKCPATGLPVSSCSFAVGGLPLDIKGNEITNELVIVNVEILWTCESFIGTVTCHYTSPQVDGALFPASNEVAAFGNGGASDDVFTGEASNSFICPASMQLFAGTTLSTEASSPGGVQEFMLTEVL